MDAIPLAKIIYLCFTLDTEEAYARRRFRERFGVEPEQVFAFKWLLWAGPVRKDEPVISER